jgi:hypothetical protein
MSRAQQAMIVPRSGIQSVVLVPESLTPSPLRSNHESTCTAEPPTRAICPTPQSRCESSWAVGAKADRAALSPYNSSRRNCRVLCATV